MILVLNHRGIDVNQVFRTIYMLKCALDLKSK